MVVTRLDSRLRALLLRTWWLGYVVALVAVALVSAVVGGIEGYMSGADLSMLYLVAVWWRTRPSTLHLAPRFRSPPAVLRER